jgi:DNA-binding winged helix-turn-helix (wHTH) protein
MPRMDTATVHIESHDAIALGGLVVDFVAREVRHHGRRIPLTYQELNLLWFLVQHRDHVFSRDELIARVWADRPLDSPRTVDIHVYRLRRKLGMPLSEMIETVRSVGYKCTRPRVDDALTTSAQPERPADPLRDVAKHPALRQRFGDVADAIAVQELRQL